MLSTWSKMYTVFARCSALVVTAEENICCEELCAKMTAIIDRQALKVSRCQENKDVFIYFKLLVRNGIVVIQQSRKVKTP